jgi:hypothetical protein
MIYKVTFFQIYKTSYNQKKSKNVFFIPLTLIFKIFKNISFKERKFFEFDRYT